MPVNLKAWAVTAVLAGIAVATAAPAVASESDFLKLKDQYNYLTTQQLLSEGYRVCGAIRNGVRSTDALDMVIKDLKVSTQAGLDIVATAIVDLEC